MQSDPTSGADAVWKGPGRIFYAVLILLAAWPALRWTASLWLDGVLGGAVPALLTPLFALGLGVIAWKRPQTPEEHTSHGELFAGRLSACALSVMAAANVAALWRPDMLMLSGLALPPALYGALILCLGAKQARRLAFPCFFLWFALPFEHFLRHVCDAPLQAWTATLAHAYLSLFGVEVHLFDDHTIYNALYYVRVDETCSGMNLLWTLWMYTLVFGWLTERRIWARSLLCALVIPLALMANGVRVAAIFVMGLVGGDALAMGFWHTGSAYLIFLPVFAVLYVAGQALQGRYRPQTCGD